MSELFATLEWTRPWGLAALVLPLFLLLHALRRPRPHELATGTVAIWRALAAQAEGSQARRHARRLPPLALLLALAALGAGALALAGPQRVAARATRTFEVLVDRSPSMDLPVDGTPGGATRLERGLAEARALLARVLRDGDRVTWSAWQDGAWSAPVAEPPAAWRDAPARAAGAHDDEPPFAERDQRGVLWVSDGPPLGDGDGDRAAQAAADARHAPRVAGRIAVAGAAVPGPVGARGTTRIDWDGVRLVEVPDALAARTVRLVTGTAPDDGARDALRDLALVLELWAAERGFAFERAPPDAAEREDDARVALALVALAEPPLVDVELARDGWRAPARVAADGLAPAARRATWLATDAGVPLVGWRAGRVDAAFAELGALAGDPAPFAASWAELFDRAQRSAAGVVPLAERRAVRALLARAPNAPDDDAHAAPRWWPTALCAACAAALAAGAVLAAEGSWRGA